MQLAKLVAVAGAMHMTDGSITLTALEDFILGVGMGE
jgi:hypothetical protein